MDANSFMMSLLYFGLVFLMLAGPFFLGGYLAKVLRMPDYGWKIGLILFTLVVSLVMVTINKPKFGIDLSGGVILIYEIDKDQLQREGKDIGSVDIEKLVDAIKLRVNPGGQKEVTIRPYGRDEIEIIIPSVTDAEKDRIKEIISQTGKLEFRILVNDFNNSPAQTAARDALKDDPGKEKTVYKNPADKDPTHWIARWYPVQENEHVGYPKYTRTRIIGGKKRTEVLVVKDPYDVTGDYLTNAQAGNDEFSKPCVRFAFNNKGGKLFGELTSDNKPSDVQSELRNQLATILDGEVRTVAGIKSIITDSGEITGNFDIEQVNKIVEVLNAGSLPAALAKTPVQELNSDAMLGAATIQKATNAMIFAALLVVAFMVAYYRFSGIIAVIALALNILGIVAVMITFKAAFTLTGFAALALTVGMAVDNNVLVYRAHAGRNRQGGGIRMAIRNAFNRAGTTIIDCNMTHVIVSIVLWTMGSDQIKGFAITLLLGVVFSMFTAVFVSHVLFDIAERHHWVTKLKMMHLIGHTSIDFMSVFPICLAFSIIITVLGLGAAYYRGYGLWDIDFTGGVSVQVLFDKPTMPDGTPPHGGEGSRTTRQGPCRRIRSAGPHRERGAGPQRRARRALHHQHFARQRRKGKGRGGDTGETVYREAVRFRVEEKFARHNEPWPGDAEKTDALPPVKEEPKVNAPAAPAKTPVDEEPAKTPEKKEKKEVVPPGLEEKPTPGKQSTYRLAVRRAASR